MEERVPGGSGLRAAASGAENRGNETGAATVVRRPRFLPLPRIAPRPLAAARCPLALG